MVVRRVRVLRRWLLPLDIQDLDLWKSYNNSAESVKLWNNYRLIFCSDCLSSFMSCTCRVGPTLWAGKVGGQAYAASWRACHRHVLYQPYQQGCTVADFLPNNEFEPNACGGFIRNCFSLGVEF